MIRNDELAVTWEEVVMAFFFQILQHMPGETGGNHEKPLLG
jgi:hypothetical protein